LVGLELEFVVNFDCDKMAGLDMHSLSNHRICSLSQHLAELILANIRQVAAPIELSWTLEWIFVFVAVVLISFLFVVP
jgi:hypothetical protein